MHGPNVFILFIVSAVFLILDLYAYQSLRTLAVPTPLRIIYWAVLLLLLLLPVVSLFIYISGMSQAEPSAIGLAFISVLVTMLATVLCMVLPLLVEDVVRLLALPVRYFTQHTPAFLPRCRWVSMLSLVMGAAMMLSMIYGMLWGKYSYRVVEKTLYFKNLPQAFDGFRIVQISDIHAGSLNCAKAVQRGVDLINAQHADMVIFSGDMVNNKATELAPWASYFEQVKAPYGKFSVLGNHDYGMYAQWKSKEEQEANLQLLIEQEAAMGFRLLKDENIRIEKNGEHMSLIGVENIGRHFVEVGNLKEALQGVDSSDFKILISHDPSHWDMEVSSYPQLIHLTLSGHTHGFQFGLETPWFKWSPVQWMYPHWAGLYERDGRYLYVNRGFGFISLFVGRVGMPPEVTVIELRRTDN